MRSQIKIVLDDDASNKAKGNCFEDLIRKLLSIHQYKIRQNIRFTGMELDLIAEHKQRHNETLYVECKAKEKVSSIELRTFFANVFHHKANFGYFFRTEELESDAGGLLQEYRTDDRYSNLTFFEPDNIIEMLLEAKMVFEPTEQLKSFAISKRILAVTHFGDFFIYLVYESNAIPTKYIIVDAQKNNEEVSGDNVERLKSRVADINSLEIIKKYRDYPVNHSLTPQEKILETISEVQESENWYDYLPASSEKNHFVGRDEIRTKILTYFKDIRNGQSTKRIFYLNGKSGWGKSSLVLELKDRCGNKHFKRKFFALAIDTRSAISDNFVALSFKKLIANSIEKKFIQKDIFQKEVTFTSNNDLISSESVRLILENLRQNNKFLVLIFDQFEDVFRKKGFFKTFYKFLTDVTDSKPNLIIGFSWKSDFFIQSDDPSYHIWQQAKEQAREFTINEFGEKEIDGIIRQLEGSVGSLNQGIKERIKESSQGLPWLTKKLCIHIYDQIQSGLAKENLIESNLNIRDLFRKDEERLSTKELKAIKLIAKRAYESNFFDETEVGDIIESETISSLLHKRLIIRSGANYNIYWDIYRDYLVTGEIPPIGESYLLRQGVNLCLEVFLLFEKDHKESLESLISKHPKDIGQETLYNILIELRNLSIIEKLDNSYIVNGDIAISRQGFADFVTSKFQNYTPYINLKKSNLSRITKTDVIQTLKSTFKQDFQDNTWDSYAKNMISWFMLSNLDIKSRLVEPKKGRGKNKTILFPDDRNELMPRSSIKEIIELIPILISNPNLISSRFNRDLHLLEIVEDSYELTDFGRLLVSKDHATIKKILREKVLTLPKMKEIDEHLAKDPKTKAKDLLKSLRSDFFTAEKESSRLIYATKAMTWLK